ncbi:hypothetical protein ACLOJK_033016 [Asimina triloba]
MGFSATSETETETPPPPLQSIPAKSHQPLHNFSLPSLSWGKRRFLRCMKADPAVDRDASQFNGSAPFPARPPPSDTRKTSVPASIDKLRPLPRIVGAKPDGGSATDDAAIEEIRERLLDHLRSAADKMRLCVPEEAEESAATPWNLRKRRPASKPPAEIGATMMPPPPPPPLPPVVPESQARSMRSRTAAAAGTSPPVPGEEKPKEKRKLTVALSKEEIEEDFFVMTGSRPARRPKKRLGKVQRQLDVRNFNANFLSFLLLNRFANASEKRSRHNRRRLAMELWAAGG